MAFIQCNFFSDTLRVAVSINLVLPDRTKKPDGNPVKYHPDRYPVLLMLHGLSDDHTVWMRWSSIERYAEEYG
jgi:S-formylglutathione hydrolase FrmB